MRRHQPRRLIRCLTLQLFAKVLILQPHVFQLLLHLPLLFVQLVLALLLLLKPLLQNLLLSKGLLITAALSQARALQTGTRVCLFGVNSPGKNSEAEQEATWFHRRNPPICKHLRGSFLC